MGGSLCNVASALARRATILTIAAHDGTSLAAIASIRTRSFYEEGLMRHASDNSACARISEIVHDLMRRRQLSPLPTIDQNLREVGLKSLDLVNMMLAIEEEFGIEIPQHQLTMDNFQSIGAIERLVTEVAA